MIKAHTINYIDDINLTAHTHIYPHATLLGNIIITDVLESELVVGPRLNGIVRNIVQQSARGLTSPLAQSWKKLCSSVKVDVSSDIEVTAGESAYTINKYHKLIYHKIGIFSPHPRGMAPTHDAYRGVLLSDALAIILTCICDRMVTHAVLYCVC